uniref:CUB domain-containing protein n=1 Tax=Macrostomum lignano TaxID=282301 RepID=A0A1I8HK94_9PLAT
HQSPKKLLCSNQQMDLLQLILAAFLGSLLAFETGSAVAVPADTGTIQCPENFGEPGVIYENSKVYNWTIRGPKVVAIRFHFVELETPYDRLEIFESTDDLETTTFTEPSDDAICSELEISDRDTSSVSIEYQWLIDRPGRIDLKLSFSDLARIYQMTTTPDKEPVFTDGPKEREGTSRFRLFGPVLQIVELELFDADGSQPHTDTISVYNGVRPLLSESPIFSQTGLLGERKAVRANGFVTVVLTTEARRSRRGLGLSYTVYSTSQEEPSGRIEFPKGSAEFNSDIDYRWFISRDIRLSIRFTSISLHPNGKLYIYENTTSEDESALRFLVTECELQRVGVPGDGESRGFRLSYAADQSATQEPLIKDSGSIRCPQVSGETYESEMEYRWTVNRLNLVVIEVTTVDIGSGVIELYEETYLTDEPQQAKLKFVLTQSNATARGAYRLPGPVMVRFVTGKDFVGQGFNLSYTTEERTLHRMLNYDSGNIFCPETALVNYEKSMDYRWTINRKSIIVIRFDFIDIQDTIEFYEKVDESGEPDRQRWKLNVTQEAAEASNITLVGPVLIRFRTNSQVTAPGFQLYYQAGRKILDSGNLSYPENYGYSKYDNNVDYEWSIYEQKTVVLTFIRYDTESNYDWIGLYENSPVHEKPDENKLKYRLTGSGYGETYTLKGPVLIRFKTDGSTNRDGFRMTYYLEETSSLSGDSGEVRWVNPPSFTKAQTQGEIGVQSSNLRNAIGLDVCDTDGYDMEIDRRWVVDTTAAVSIRFVQAQLLSGCDKLELHERTKIPTPRSRVFSLTDAPLSDLMSTEFKLRGPAVVRLQSRRMRPTIVPFGATFIDDNCAFAKLERTAGLPHARWSKQLRTEFCARAWSIAVSPQQTVELQLFDAEGGQPHGDTVSVYTGVEPRLSESPIFSQTGLLGERKTLRASGFVTVVLRTDDANEAKRGFGLKYSVENVLLSGRSGEIRFPQNSSADSSAFDLDMDYSWIIQSSGSVRINVRSLNLQDGDKLHLYENTTSKDELKRRFVLADASASESEFWLRGSVLIRITAAGDGSPRSFRLAYQSDPDLKLENAVEVVKSSRGTRWSFPKFDTTDRTERAKIVWVIAPKPSHEFTVHILFKVEGFFEFFPDSYTCGWFVYAGNWLTQRLSNDSFEAQFKGLTQHVSQSGPVSVYWEQIQESHIASRCTDLVFQFDYQIRNVHRYLSEDSGSLRCPEESSSTYANEMEYRWTINRRNFVLITVTSADIGYGNDIIQLYEMTDGETDEPEESKLRFTLTQANATSATYKLIGPVLIRFSTDESLVGQGFSLSYTVEERTFSRNLLNDSGSIRCPNEEYEAYEHQMDYRWYIPSSRVVFLTVRSMGIQDANDVVEFYEKTDSSAEPQPENRKYTLTGDSWSSRKYVLIGPALIRFKTDRQNASRGFIIDYYLDRYVVDSGKLQCPENFGSGYYLNSKTYAWWIGDLSLLEIKVDSYDVETGIDKISFYEKTQLFEDAQDSKKAHVVGPVLIQFVTDYSITKAGFNLSYSALDSRNEKADVVCSEGEQLPAEEEMKYDLETDYRWLIDRQGWVSLKLSHADIVRLYEMTADPSEDRLAFVSEHRSMTNATSVEFRLRGPVLVRVTTKRTGSTYANEMEYRWTINRRNFVLITVTSADIGYGNDIIQLYEMTDGETDEPEESKLRFTLTQANATSATYKLIGPVLIRFSTDKRLVGQGFDLSYSIEPRTVIANQSQSFAMIQCPNDTNSTMEKWMEYKWLIPGKYVYKLAFNRSNLGADGSFIEVFAISDQESADADEQNLLFILTDANATSADFVLTGPLLIRVKTGRRFDGRGIAFSYRRGPVVVSEDLGTIKCPSNYGSSMYANSKDYQWLIDTTGPVNIRMEEVDIENCCDKIFIYDRFSISDEVDDSKLTTSLVNNNATGVSLSLQGPVLVRFKTDSSVTSRGFRLIYSTQSLDVGNTTNRI